MLDGECRGEEEGVMNSVEVASRPPCLACHEDFCSTGRRRSVRRQDLAEAETNEMWKLKQVA